MKLKWVCDNFNETIDITDENISKVAVNHAETMVGILELSVFAGRIYKDNTRQWMIYLRCPNANSKEIITLDKIRGKLPDAIEAAEKKLFAKPFPKLEETV